MNIAEVLPSSGLPRTFYPAGREVNWAFDAERENYFQRGGHPLYGENDVTYRFNSRGYRCPEFDTAADIRVVTIGCSYVFGLALPQSALFHERFAEKLRARVFPRTVVLWNLGLAGSSNDYITRLLHFAVPLLQPHLLLINFTHLSRREYMSVQNRYMNYNAFADPKDEITKEIWGHFAALSNSMDDQLNFFRNYKAVEGLLSGRHWLFSHRNPKEFAPLSDHLDHDRFVGDLKGLDRARDHSHPGPESHRRLAELYWEKFTHLGAFSPAT